MPSSNQKRPNVCLILIDALRADHLSCYGYSRIETVHIDQIASEGALYEQAIGASSWTLQSVASLFTALYPSQHHASWRYKFLDDEHVTLAEVLERAGYHTVGWSANPLVDRSTNLHRGFQEFNQITWTFRPSANLGLPSLVDRAFRRLHRELVGQGGNELARLFRRSLGELAGKEDPFFAFLFFLEPHAPYRPRRKTARRLLPQDVSQSQAQKINWRPNNYYVGKAQMSERDFGILTALYDAEIVDTDERIGATVDALRQAGILDDTIVIISADHGENFGHHGLMGHSHCLYDDLIRVPLIIRYPKLFPPGMRVSEQVQAHDLFFTLLEAAEVEPSQYQYPARPHRFSLLPDQLKKKARRWTFAERLGPRRKLFESLAQRHPRFDITRYVRELRAVRGEGWKYIWADDGHEELYDLGHDPTEQDNLVLVCPDKACQLRQVLEEELPLPDETGDRDDLEMDEAMLDRLRALGYVD
jgi:arylsulfatase A-like enzyme